MRVVHVCRAAWPQVGGMETAVHGLARALRARGHDSWVVTLRADGSGEGTHEGVRYVRLRRVGPRRYPLAVGLRAALRGADVVHVHGTDGLADQVVRLRRTLGAPVGISTHGGFLHTGRTPLLKATWLRTVTRATLRRADAVWYTSHADAVALAAAGVPGEVLGNGVDVAPLLALPRAPEPGRWLVVGRVDVHKGLDDLVDALAAVARRDPRPFTVDVLGPERVPGLTEALGRRVDRRGLSGRVRFLGAVDDATLRNAWQTAEVALFPSRYEGFGIAVVEAMAAGVPVVARWIPAFAELLDEGRYGALVDVTDPEALRAALERARGEDGAEIARGARDRAAEYGWERRVIAWEEAYARLVAGGPG